MIAPESWRPIPGFAGRYSASDRGRVRSEPRIERTTHYPHGRAYRGKVLAAWTNEHGYALVMLTRADGGGRTHERVHRLVCAAFHGPAPTPGHEPNHLNSDRLDNRACNLAWVTRSENIQHSYDLGGRVATPARGEACGTAKLTEAQVRDLRQRFAAGESRAALALEFGVDRSNVWMIGTHRSWKQVA